MTEEQKEDPLNPDGQRLLFEKLSMSEEDLDELEYIRHHMRIIVKQEVRNDTGT